MRLLIYLAFLLLPATDAMAANNLDSVTGFFSDLFAGKTKKHVRKTRRPVKQKRKFSIGSEKKPAITPEMLNVQNQLNLPYIPIPRPKPGSQSGPAPHVPTAPVRTTNNGQVYIPVEQLKRERDEKKARELRPNTNSHWNKLQIAEANKRCNLVLATTNIDADRLKPIGGPGGCGIAAPILVRSLGNIQIKPAAKLNCNMALALYKWAVDGVQPIARSKYKQPVVSIRSLSSYSCRSRRGSGTSRISEHSFGNALDVASFTLANGKTISLLKDWSTAGSIFGINRDATFLNDVHKKACQTFATTLSPRYNKAHANHFHIDLGRGGRYKICK